VAATLQDRTGVDTSSASVHVRASDETKPSYKTTEMIVMVAAVAGVFLAGMMDDSMNTLWTWILISALAIGYLLSRGLAKSGSQHHESA
jgi:hypothetical protein